MFFLLLLYIVVYQEISSCRFCREEFVYDTNLCRFVQEYNHENNLSNMLCNCNNPYIEMNDEIDIPFEGDDNEGIYEYNDDGERENILTFHILKTKGVYTYMTIIMKCNILFVIFEVSKIMIN